MSTFFASRFISRLSARAATRESVGAWPRLLAIRSFGSTTPSLSDDSGVVHVSIDEARGTTAKALEKLGWDAEDAALQAEIMTAAELCGNNQGLFFLLLATPSRRANSFCFHSIQFIF